MSLPLQPLDFKDFSGGQTDNFFQSDIRRFQYADNYLISVDKKLDVRYGTTIFDSVGYRLPSGDQRVNSFFSFINETILLGQSGNYVYVFPGTAQDWAEIISPDGTHHALPVNDTTSQVTSAEFQHQLYLTTEYNNGQAPVKLFQDEDNNWRSVTVGLPRTNTIGVSNWPNSSLLAKCITNANILKAALVAHYADTAQHQAADPAGVTLNAVANASDWATLQTLMTALATAYEEHRYDLAGPSPFIVSASPVRAYHFASGFGNMSLKMVQTAAVVAKAAQNILDSDAVQMRNALKYAAAFLDDLLVKFFWHVQSPTGHQGLLSLRTFTAYSKTLATNHIVATSNLIGTITEGEPLVVPTYNAFIDMVSYLLAVMNNHYLEMDRNYTGTLGATMHTRRDFNSVCPLDAPTDYYSAIAVLAWLRYGYGFSHSGDVRIFAVDAPVTGTMSTTLGSAVTTLNTIDFPFGVSLSPQQRVGADLVTFNPIDTSDQRDSFYATVVSISGSTGAWTVTFDRVVQFTDSLVPTQSSGSNFHTFNVDGLLANLPSGWVPNQNQILYGNNAQGTDTSSIFSKTINPGTFSVPYDPYDLKSWNSFAEELALAFGEHIYDVNVHPAQDFFDTEAYFVKPGLTLLDGNDFYIPNIVSYSYAFQYQHNYTVQTNGLQYLVNSNPVITSSIETCQPYVQGDNVATFDVNVYGPKVIEIPTYASKISGVPALTNSSITNYDLDNIISQIYRTTDGGNTYYLVTNLPLATSTYTDYTADDSASPDTSALVTNETLYTNGGVVGSDQPPLSKYIHFCNGYTYYGGITEVTTNIGGEIITQSIPNRVLQSVSLAPDWVPATFSDDLDDAIVGINSFRSIPIVLCTDSVFRLENNYTTTGQGFISHFKISENIGALNAKSIVKTEVGLFYAATDGFYYTDGYQIIKVSLDLDSTYLSNTLSATQRQRIVGAYDKSNRRVYWSMINDNGAEPTVLFVYYLNYGVKPSGVFNEVYSGVASWIPSSHIFWNGMLVVGDSRGYVFKGNDAIQSDPIVNTAANPSTWGISEIPYFYASCIFDFGTGYKNKVTPKIRFIGKNMGNAYIDIAIVNDADELGKGYYYCTPIKYIKNSDSENPLSVGRIDEWRRFPAGSLKSNLKQLIVKPSTRVFVYDQTAVDDFTSVQLLQSGGNNIVKMTGLTWPTLSETDQLSIGFDIDEYKERFPVLNYAFATGEISVSDPNNQFANFMAESGGFTWSFQMYTGLTIQKHNISNMIIQFAEAISDVGGGYGENQGGSESAQS